MCLFLFAFDSIIPKIIVIKLTTPSYLEQLTCSSLAKPIKNKNPKTVDY